MALVAVVIGFGTSWTSLCVLEILIVWAIAEFLILQFPSRIRHVMNSNCIRMDGSFSQGRKRVELAELSKQRQNVVLMLGAIFAASTLLLWVAGTDIQHLFTDNASGKTSGSFANASELTLGFQELLETKSDVSLETKRQAFVRGSSYIFIIGLFWLIGCCLGFHSAYFWMLKQTLVSAKDRADSYRLRDFRRMSEFSDYPVAERSYERPVHVHR